MTTQEKKSPEGNDTLPKDAMLIFGTILNTSARLFFPIIGLMVLGLLLDKAFLTKPWLMITGLLIGCFVAKRLVQKQLRDVQKGETLSIDKIALLAKLSRQTSAPTETMSSKKINKEKKS